MWHQSIEGGLPCQCRTDGIGVSRPASVSSRRPMAQQQNPSSALSSSVYTQISIWKSCICFFSPKQPKLPGDLCRYALPPLPTTPGTQPSWK